MATYCSDSIFAANFAPMGGRAEDRITAPDAGGLWLGNSDGRAEPIALLKVIGAAELLA